MENVTPKPGLKTDSALPAARGNLRASGEALADVLARHTTVGSLWRAEGDRIRCVACGHRCLIPAGRHGICRVRFNQGGQLRVPFGYVGGVQCDPVEKKPFFHVYPGTDALTFGMVGCDFHCSYCQNWVTSQALRDANGSGKTTLFRILSTLMIPTAGRAVVMGCDAAQDAASLRRQIGVVFQAQSVDGKLTAYENLWHQGHLYGLRGAALKKRVGEILTRVGLADRAKERVETFSGGMQRRIELAKGLLHHPGVLLLDEPTTGLDPGARRDLWQYLQMLRDEEHVSVLVTTHLMEEAERCDRLAIMNEGNLVALGTPTELKSEIGGDVILLDAAHDAGLLAEHIRAR